jgi:nucleotide-binding universal stress UspA family protein
MLLCEFGQAKMHKIIHAYNCSTGFFPSDNFSSFDRSIGASYTKESNTPLSKENEEVDMRIKNILFPTDFSQGARAAMDHAISLAQDYKAKLILFHVIQEISIAEWYIPSTLSVAEVVADIEKNAWQEMEKWAAEVSANITGVEKAIVRGIPFVEIIRAAREKNADLIIIGTHGRTGIDHMLFGSTAEKVVRKAPCPVLTVRIAGKEFKMP